VDILPQPNGVGSCLPCAGTAFGQPSTVPCPQGVVPGPQGEPGANGAPGTGANAFTLTNAAFTMPAVSATVAVAVLSTAWMATGQVVYVQSAGYFLVASIQDATDVIFNNLGYTGNAAPGTVIASVQPVTPGGLVGPAGSAGGGVTSVGLSAPAIFTVSGSPVTLSGILSFTLASQLQNRVWVSPNGASGAPTFRALLLADLPTIPYSSVTLTTTKGDIIVRNASNDVRMGIGSDGQVLTANSAAATGMNWANPVTQISTTRRRATVSPDTMQATDSIIGVVLASAFSETLAVAPTDGRQITIKDESGTASSNNITVFAGAGDTIQGSPSKVINTDYGYLSLYYDATDKIWFITGSA